MNKDLRQAIDFFISRPKLLEKSTGKFINGVYGGKIFLGKSRQFVQDAKDKARQEIHESQIEQLRNEISEKDNLLNKKFNSEKGECTIDGLVNKRIKTLDDLIEACEIDTSVWEVASWECNKWEIGRKDKQVDWNSKEGVTNGFIKDSGKVFVEPLFQVKVKLVKIKNETVFRKEFEKFLSTYKPLPAKIQVVRTNYPKENSIFILPKQDAHFNRVDVKGRNSIENRFKLVEDATIDIIREASALHKLDKITYIVGSDQFNSEWTSLTTGGTLQHNICSYQESFKLICDHEITIINNLIANSLNVEILFVPGNHDEYAGWHLINWLQCYFRSNPNVRVTEGNIDDPRRYERYSNTALMFDHGAKLNGKELAQRFPLEFKDEWSKCEYYYIFSGDKHHELSLDVQGIKYYRVPALTPTKSKWEHSKGYLSKGEIQAFLIKEGKGLTNMYSRMLE